MKLSTVRSKIILSSIVIVGTACQKTGTVPSVAGPAAFTVVNAMPTSTFIIPVVGTSSAITYFKNAERITYGGFYEYSPSGGNDTIYAVQRNNDTLDIGPKAIGLMFYNILDLDVGGIYSLFLTGADTNSPDYLFVRDTIPFYPPTDSVVGIRFVNLSTGSNPISINLEGSANGSEVGSLPYKGITSFKQYVNNSTVQDYLYVIRDAATGDSLTQFDFVLNGGGNYGIGLTDPNNGNLLTFKSVTIAIYGSEDSMSNFPLTTMLIDDY